MTNMSHKQADSMKTVLLLLVKLPKTIDIWMANTSTWFKKKHHNRKLHDLKYFRGWTSVEDFYTLRLNESHDKNDHVITEKISHPWRLEVTDQNDMDNNNHIIHRIYAHESFGYWEQNRTL